MYKSFGLQKANALNHEKNDKLSSLNTESEKEESKAY